MAKSDMMYFENLIGAAECACEAAKYLVACLTDYKPEQLKAMLEKMHEYEHAADIKKHGMSNALAKAFVTPVDREDLAVVSQNIDEVTDAIEEVLQMLYMYNIKTTFPKAIVFAKKLSETCEIMKQILDKFSSFKHPQQLHELVIEVNHMEEECDALHMEATMELENMSLDPLQIISWREIYSCMERCADACEHVGDSVEMVIMKNS